MKKLLSFLGTATIITSSASVFAYADHLNNVNSSKVTNNAETLDWNEISSNLFDVFKKASLYSQKEFKVLNSNNQAKSTQQTVSLEAVLNYAQAETAKMLSDFQEQNLTLDEIISTIKTNVNDFEEVFDQQETKPNASEIVINQNLRANDLESVKNFQESDTISQEEQDVKNRDLVLKIQLARNVIASGAAAAAIAAVGFYAAAWFFGISIPFAVGCTVASALLTAAAGGLAIALGEYDYDMQHLERFTTILLGTMSVAHVLASVSLALLYTLLAAVTAFSWCFPAVTAVIAVVSMVIGWVNYANY